ncbi:MAG: hypothetical protein JNN22_10120 [Rhodospirillales bacterium]|nr:hypothetical protein [Rhodospirillales bacterium]
MDRQHCISRVDCGLASGLSDQLDHADEFANALSIEDLAARWHCSLKTARARIVANGLGINPAGTWLISWQRVRGYEESLRVGAIANPKANAISTADEVRDHVKTELVKLGILRSRRFAPNKEAWVSRPYRKAG